MACSLHQGACEPHALFAKSGTNLFLLAGQSIPSLTRPQVGSLCTGAGCRRKAVLRYFGEQRGGCDAADELPCDWCQDRQVRLQHVPRIH